MITHLWDQSWKTTAPPKTVIPAKAVIGSVLLYSIPNAQLGARAHAVQQPWLKAGKQSWREGCTGGSVEMRTQGCQAGRAQNRNSDGQNTRECYFSPVPKSGGGRQPTAEIGALEGNQGFRVSFSAFLFLAHDSIFKVTLQPWMLTAISTIVVKFQAGIQQCYQNPHVFPWVSLPVHTGSKKCMSRTLHYMKKNSLTLNWPIWTGGVNAKNLTPRWHVGYRLCDRAK